MSFSPVFPCRIPGVLAAFAIVLTGTCNCLGQTSDSNPRTFYVDSSCGNDDQEGLAPNQAWKTLDRVNEADLKPGDTIRFKRGETWRGSLVPVSGEEGTPITYTSYGEGAKPLLLGSKPRNRQEDWVRINDHIWATLPMEYIQGDQVADLRRSHWSHHQEQGASVRQTHEDTSQGTLIRLACVSSGKASNHIQLWGPTLAVEKGTQLQFTFRARCSKPFVMPSMSINQGSSPWTRYATSTWGDGEIRPKWKILKVVFGVTESAEGGRLHCSIGGILPEEAVFEFQPQTIDLVTANVADPLTVDVGNIIFDHGRKCGWKKWSTEDLEQPYDYFYDGTSRRVFLNCPANPATLHESIELAMKGHVINQSGKHHVVYDGLAVMYGASHGFGGGGTHRLIIRNCDLGYIGGAHQFTHPNGRPVRFGNAIEFWGAAQDHLVENCRIWEVYDAALTNQGRGPASETGQHYLPKQPHPQFRVLL